MRNINEMIGIIEGINFDGVINDKEVVRLQSWVNKNRNLAFEPRQVELIQLVDDILEDQIITEEEREVLINFARKYITEMGDNTSAIYELNGIIEGIICDGVVNEAEVYNLRDWMDEYADQVRDHKPSAELCKIVDDILEDEIVTEEEQKKLLKILTGRINNSKFETKLSYLCKLVRAKKNIGIDLIDILDNQDAIIEIHERAEIQLRGALESNSGMFLANPEVVFVSLCLIAMLDYDGSYYDSVRRTYKNLYKYFSEQKVEGQIRDILYRYRSDSEKNISGRSSRYINAALYNAIVPSHFLKNFFLFIYDIYKLNFEYDLPDDLYEEFKFVYEGLHSSMNSDVDEFQDNVTRKTYKLIKTTQRLISQKKDLDSVIQLSIIVVKLIDQYIWNKNPKLYNPYLKKGYEEWAELFNDDIIVDGRRAHSEWRSRWKPKFVLDRGSVYLLPPVHKVKSSYNYWEIRLEVFSDNRLIYTDDRPDIRELVAGYQVIPNRIKLDAPLNKISYKLMAGTKVIYDSKDKLYRKYIVFSVDGSEISNNTDYKGNAVFCYKNACSGLKPWLKEKDYKLSSKNVNYGDFVYIENEIFNFTSLVKPGVFGDTYDNLYLQVANKDGKIQVFKKIKYLVFESDRESQKFEISINNKPYKLADFNCTTTKRENIYKYVIDLNIDSDGIYCIEIKQVDNGRKKKIASFIFALDKNFETKLEKLDDAVFAYEVVSGLTEAPIMGQINLDELADSTVSLEYNGKPYQYMIPFDFNAYRIDGGEWRSLSDELWIGDVKNDSMIDIYDIELDQLLVYSDAGQLLVNSLMKNKGVYRQVDIGCLVTYKEKYDYVVLVFLKDGRQRKGMFCNNKCTMRDETELLFNEETQILRINTWFYGKGNVYFEIFNADETSIYKSSILKNNSLTEVPNMESYTEYMIRFYEKAKGLSLKKNRLIKEYRRVFYARKDYVGKNFHITKAYVDIAGVSMQEYSIKNAYVHIVSPRQDGKYNAELFISTKNRKFRSNIIKNVVVDICGDAIDHTLDMVITKNGNLLNADFDRNYVTTSDNSIGNTVSNVGYPVSMYNARVDL